MPGKIGVKIKGGRNLPIMDKSSETCDAFVEIKLGNVTHKTEVCRKSLNPQWNTDWFRFEVDDAELQDEPLQIRLMDYDIYSANDAIGKVNISLNPLLSMESMSLGKGTVFSGWIPVFDTMHGIRGEVNVIVKVDLFSDVNKFRQSSCGIPFFHSQCIPYGYRAHIIHGFVEELVVNDDPEYQWIDKIRTPRASNEARQVVFLKLSGQVQRKIGLKAINIGANAVVGYTQCFDLEGDVGVVARGIGTAVTLIKDSSIQTTSTDAALIEESLNEVSPVNQIVGLDSPCMKRFASPASAAVVAAAAATGSQLSQSPTKSPSLANAQSESPSSVSTVLTATSNSTATTVITKEVGEMFRRSSDSDLSVTPKGNSICVASERLIAATAMMRLNQSNPVKGNPSETIDMMEYPFLTMTRYPYGFIQHLGATVAARSVKLLERVPNPDEPEIRDSWWTELRMEIRSHARSLGCNVVLGYSESTTISDDVCVLSATGTAAIINMTYNRSISQNDIYNMSKVTGGMSTTLEERDKDSLAKESGTPSSSANNSAGKKSGAFSGYPLKNNCNICHVPYNFITVLTNTKMKRCAICRKGRVPDVILATLEVPEFVQVTGHGCLIQAHVVRVKKDLRSELNAKEISDALPFLEYELHRVLINKLKAKGMNAIFGLKAQVSVGERFIAIIATGTALFLSALPVPQVPKIIAGNSWTDKQKLNEIQKKLQETFDRNQEVYQLKCIDSTIKFDATIAGSGGGVHEKHSDTSDSDDDVMELDLNCGNKDACILEVDDIEDLEIISSLMEAYPPEGFHVVNTQMVPGMQDMEIVKNLQMFTQVWRAKLGPNANGFSKHFQRILQTIFYKLRTMIPCAICDLKFHLDLPETDQIQLLITGMVLDLADISKYKYLRCNKSNINDSNVNLKQPTETNGTVTNKRTIQEDDYIFPLDEDEVVETPTPTTNLPPMYSQTFKNRKTSPLQKKNTILRNNCFPLRGRYGVDITPLSFIPGAKIEKYLGNLNFFFIRESTSIRENGGISGFIHSFITELLAVVRAHISALGGNAMVAFYMTELILLDNQHKNQAQCLISIGGDAVHVLYSTDD